MKHFTFTKGGRPRHPDQRGFTLIEAIIVIALIAILAVIAMAGYGAWKDNAHKSVMTSDLRRAATQMEIAKNETGTLPTTIPNFTASSGYTVKMGVAGGGTTTLPAPVRALQETMAGVPSYFNIRGLAVTSTFNAQKVTVNISCDSSFSKPSAVNPNELLVWCSWPGRTESDPVFSMNSAQAVCAYSTTNLATQTFSGPRGSILKRLPNDGSYVEGSPQSYSITQGFNSCSSVPQLGFGSLNVRISGMPETFALAGGILAPPPAADGSYCLQATSPKTAKIYSYRVPGGLAETAC